MILVVFLLRSFLVEPFKIPSARCAHALVGDFILVNKFTYGIRLPVVETKVVAGRAIRSAATWWCSATRSIPAQDYIKRVVGVGGDVVSYQDKRLTVNGQPVPQVRDGTYSYLENLRFETLDRYKETARNGNGTHEYMIGITPRPRPSTRRTCGRSPAARIANTMTAVSPARCRRASTS